MFIVLPTFRDMEYVGKLIMGIFASLHWIIPCLPRGIWDIGNPTIYKFYLYEQ